MVSQNQSRRFGEIKNILPPPGIDLRFLGRPACILVITQATLFPQVTGKIQLLLLLLLLLLSSPPTSCLRFTRDHLPRHRQSGIVKKDNAPRDTTRGIQYCSTY